MYKPNQAVGREIWTIGQSSWSDRRWERSFIMLLTKLHQ